MQVYSSCKRKYLLKSQNMRRNWIASMIFLNFEIEDSFLADIPSESLCMLRTVFCIVKTPAPMLSKGLISISGLLMAQYY